MTAVISECVRCNAPMEVTINLGQAPELRCPRCNVRQVQYIYPMRREVPEPGTADIAVDASATCFFHETSGATHICEDCGRYVCALCTVALPLPANKPEGFPSHVCPACFANRADTEMQGAPWDLFRTRYPRYDMMAHFLFLVPVGLVLTFALTPLTTPVALYLALRHWRRCRNPVARFRLSSSIAIACHLVVVLLWVMILAAALAGVSEVR